MNQDDKKYITKAAVGRKKSLLHCICYEEFGCDG